MGADGQSDGAALGSVFDRIVEQVDHDLLQARPVAFHPDRVRQRRR